MQQYTRWLLLIHQEPRWVYLKKKIPTNLATLSTKDHSLQLIQFLVIYAEPQGQLYFQKKLIILILQIASGSDDLSVIIWDWEKEKNLLAFNTGHTADVFQVRTLSTMFIIIFRKKILDGYGIFFILILFLFFIQHYFYTPLFPILFQVLSLKPCYNKFSAGFLPVIIIRRTKFASSHRTNLLKNAAAIQKYNMPSYDIRVLRQDKVEKCRK